MHKQISNKKVFNKSSGCNAVSFGDHMLLFRMTVWRPRQLESSAIWLCESQTSYVGIRSKGTQFAPHLLP